LVGGDHNGVVGKRDMESSGCNAFVGIRGRDGEEVAGGAGVEDGGCNLWRQGGTKAK
jgi:hypothetical protein